MACAAGDVLLLHNLTPHASFTNSSADTVRWSLDLRYADHAAPNNVGEDPQSYTPERDPVTMACYPPEADFVPSPSNMAYIVIHRHQGEIEVSERHNRPE